MERKPYFGPYCTLYLNTLEPSIVVVCRAGEHQHRWHIDVHYVKISTHTQGVKLKHNGIWGWGIYGLDGWGSYGLDGWGSYGSNGRGSYGSNGRGSYGKMSYCIFWGYGQKTLVFRGVPFQSLHDHRFRSL